MTDSLEDLCARGAQMMHKQRNSYLTNQKNYKAAWEFMKEKGKINIGDIESPNYQSDLQTYETSDGVQFQVAYYPPNDTMPSLSNVVVVFAWIDVNKPYTTHYYENGESSGNYCNFKLTYWKEFME